jgi:hypothetical protein
MPTIKYLKDNEDDCDLDPRLFVSDLLLDEGKAQRDGADQRVTIKVILEQGRGVREGSVAVGSQLDNPQYHLQYQKTSRPPVPSFPGVSSSLGKRSFPTIEEQEEDNHTPRLNGTKRHRHVEIPQSQREESLASSIEHEGSPELVRNTQTFFNSHPDHAWERPLIAIKFESPGAWGDILPATVDELEELSRAPQVFTTTRREERSSDRLRSSSQMHQTNGVSSSQEAVSQSHAPVTPPGDAFVRRSTSIQHQSPDHTRPGQLTSLSTSGGRFKRARGSVYDLPESDIDDSQMSPRSRQAQLNRRISSDRLSLIATLRSPNASQEAGHQQNVRETLKVLDAESGFGMEAEHFARPAGSPTNDGDLQRTDDSTNDVYEDAPTDGPDVQTADPVRSDSLDADKENDPTFRQSAEGVCVTESGPPGELAPAKDGAHGKPASSPAVPTNTAQDAPPKKRRQRMSRKSTSANSSVVGDDEPPSKTTAKGRGRKSVKIADGAPFPHASKGSITSPGEQLSQDLQDSTQERDRTAVKTKPVKQGATKAKKATPVPRSQKAKADKLSAATADPAAEGTDSTASRTPKGGQPFKPLPAWGSADKNKSPTGPSNSLAVDKVDDTRKSPSTTGVGLTEEEIRIMKSREGMTEAEYEAAKKRRLEEAKRQRDEARRQAKRQPARESWSKPPRSSETPGPTVHTPAAPKSGSSGSEPSTASSSRKSDVGPTPKTPGKATTKTTPSAKSTVSKSAKAGDPPPDVQTTSKKSTPASSTKAAAAAGPQPKATAKTAAKTPAKTPAAARRAESVSEPAKPKVKGASQPEAAVAVSAPRPRVSSAAPTIATATNLSDLHAALRKTHEAANNKTTAATTPASRPSQKKSLLNASSSDESSSSDEDSSDSSGEDDATKTTKAGGADKSKSLSASTTTTTTSGSSSSSSDESPAKTKTPGKTPGKSKVGGSKANSKPPVRPDPSIRDASGASESDGSSDEDDEGGSEESEDDDDE